MKSKIFTKIIIILTIALSFCTLIPASSTYAEDICSKKGSVPDEVWEAAGCAGNENALRGIITGILNSIIAISGLVAVIYVVIGGVNYMTSSGDAAKLEKAKKTILYATIGLVISVLAFAIVNWAISAISNGTSGDTENTTNESTEESTENSFLPITHLISSNTYNNNKGV